jgi:hypothetical protein
MIGHSSVIYGRDAKNRIDQTREPGLAGARALIESFYYAFNQRDLASFKQVWANHELIQLNNPLGGILRGDAAIVALYQRIFSGSATVWVALSDIVEFQTHDMVVFAGRETGEFVRNGETLELKIRTTRIVQWMDNEIGWRQVHHHGSIDDPLLLGSYQVAVR